MTTHAITTAAAGNGLALTTAEQQRLADLEETIELGRAAFVAVGAALIQIRDQGLFRETHNTFEEYYRERWGFGKSQAYRLIDATKIIGSVSPIGDVVPRRTHLEGNKFMEFKTPYRDLVPPLSTTERESLAADIRENGQMVEALIDEDGNILDGHHRYEVLKTKLKTRTIRGLDEAGKEAFVLRVADNRRNMSPDQLKDQQKKKRKVAPELKMAGRTQAQIAVELGVGQQTVSDWLAKKKQSNTGSGNTLRDCRVKVNPKKKPEIAKRVKSGESTAQVAADYKVTPQTVRNIVTAETKQAEAVKKRKAAARAIKGNAGIFTGDFRQIGQQVASGSAALVFTDPPYDRGAASLYADLAEFASRVLRPGGWCLAYSGHFHLQEVLDEMSQHLTYGWVFSVTHSGGDTRIRKYKLRTGWKPIVGFYKPPLGTIPWDWFRDTVSGGREKSDHKWQQSEAEAAHFIEAMTFSGELVCDPFCGSGTTCVAANRLGRKHVAFEIDESAAQTARERNSSIISQEP